MQTVQKTKQETSSLFFSTAARNRLRFFAPLLAWGSGSLALAFVLMAFTAWSRYTTIGIDSDRADGPFVYYSYYRIRWPGDGSFRVGSGAFRYGHTPGKALEPFDLGGRFFLPPHHEPPHTVWNRAGFWLINNTWDDERTRTDFSAPKPREAWVGVPAVLPALGFGVPIWFYVREQRKKARRETGGYDA